VWGAKDATNGGLRPVPGLSPFYYGKAFRQAPPRVGVAGLLARSQTSTIHRPVAANGAGPFSYFNKLPLGWRLITIP
jgi:hypothetical protein